MVHALFRLPKEGSCCTLHNSYNGTNTVLRPGESREGEGRKKENKCNLCSMPPFLRVLLLVIRRETGDQGDLSCLTQCSG